MVEIINTLKELKDLLIPVLGILCAVLGLKSIGYKIVTQIMISATKWIQELEKESSLSGPEKMELVISYVKNLVPRFFKVTFSDKVISSMAESIFEDMQKYSDNRVERKTGLKWNEMLKVVEESQASANQESGLYTFKDGTTMRYMGGFEKSLLEYMDQHNMVPEAPKVETKEEEMEEKRE